MRQWMTPPRDMCRQHLLGEHVEHHMFIGSLKKGVDLTGYLKNNLMELGTLNTRHDALVKEMLVRGYNHKSPLEDEFAYIPVGEGLTTKIDVVSAAAELYRRCSLCRDIKEFNRLENLYAKE